MFSWWGTYLYLNSEQFKEVIVKSLVLHMVHQDNFDREEGRNLLDITYIYAEEVISIQTQNRLMYYLTNML